MPFKSVKIFFRLSIAIILTLGLSISFQSLLAAWTAPTSQPPNGNSLVPVFNQHTSPTSNVLVGFPTGVSGNFSVTGNIATQNTNNVTSGAFIYSSDITLKENIQPINNALDKVLQLNGVSFDWKESGKSSLGVIAQEVEGVFPELVHTNEATGLKSVEYGNLVAPLIEAIKEQQKQIDELKKQVDELKK